MIQSFWTLSYKRIIKRKRESFITFFVLSLSLAFMVITLCITSSISSTNDEYRINTYGEWYAAYPLSSIDESDVLHNLPGIDKIGITQRFGTLEDGSLLGIGDALFFELGHIQCAEGRLPQKSGEVAMEMSLLDKLGYSYNIG